MKCGRFIDKPFRIAAIIKIPAAVLHVSNCPQSYFQGQLDTVGITIAEKDERVDRLRATLDIQR